MSRTQDTCYVSRWRTPDAWSELATAVREHVPIVVLIWEDQSYGLIKWKMDLELGHHSSVDFHNPDFVMYAADSKKSSSFLLSSDQINFDERV